MYIRCLIFLLLFFSTLEAAKYPALSLNDPQYAWMDEQIEEDFAGYRDGFTAQDFSKKWKNVGFPIYSFTRYQVIRGKVFGPPGAITNLLEVMKTVYPIPDVEFIYCYYDRGETQDFPVFASAAKRGSKGTIHFIDQFYDILSNHGYHRQIKEMHEAFNKWPWNKKLDKAIWRGSATDGADFGGYTLTGWMNPPRGKICYLSRYVASDLLDAAFVPFPATRDLVENYDEFVQRVPMADFLPPKLHSKYKYQISLDGISATYPGLQWKLLSGCLTFKQEEVDTMWFYKGLKPWVHYVPINRDCSDLLEKIQWAKAHDDEARQIAENARKFARQNLMPEHILLYCYKVLLKQASLQKYKPLPYRIHQIPHQSPFS